MALIDIACSNGHIHEVYRAAADWPKTPECPDCASPTEQIHRPRQTTWSVDPVVVFKASDGTYRFPGDKDGLSAKNYERQGLERVEIRGAAEMRHFESTMNKSEYSRASRAVERKHAMREMREKESRSTLRQAMQSMSPYGRDLARAAMEQNDSKPRERASSSEFHSEVYSFTRGSREASRDEQGRRRRD